MMRSNGGSEWILRTDGVQYNAARDIRGLNLHVGVEKPMGEQREAAPELGAKPPEDASMYFDRYTP